MISRRAFLHAESSSSGSMAFELEKMALELEKHQPHHLKVDVEIKVERKP